MRHQRATFLCTQLVQVVLPPFDSGEFVDCINPEQLPFGFASLEREKKVAVGIGHAADDGFNHRLSHLNEILDGYRATVMPSKPWVNS